MSLQNKRIILDHFMSKDGKRVVQTFKEGNTYEIIFLENNEVVNSFTRVGKYQELCNLAEDFVEGDLNPRLLNG
jgi:hypothetical protein